MSNRVRCTVPTRLIHELYAHTRTNSPGAVPGRGGAGPDQLHGSTCCLCILLQECILHRYISPHATRETVSPTLRSTAMTSDLPAEFLSNRRRRHRGMAASSPLHRDASKGVKSHRIGSPPSYLPRPHALRPHCTLTPPPRARERGRAPPPHAATPLRCDVSALARPSVMRVGAAGRIDPDRLETRGRAFRSPRRLTVRCGVAHTNLTSAARLRTLLSGQVLAPSPHRASNLARDRRPGSTSRGTVRAAGP